jgi:hypothetical protein
MKIMNILKIAFALAITFILFLLWQYGSRWGHNYNFNYDVGNPPQIALEASNAFAYVGDQGNIFVFDLRITETGGGANINFLRLEVYRSNGEFVERQEHGAGVIQNVTGSNRIEANESRLLEQVAFVFRAAFKKGPTMVVAVGFTDDTGRTFQEVQTFVCRG